MDTKLSFSLHCRTFRSGHLRPMTIPPSLSGAAHKLVVGQDTEITPGPGIGGQISVHAAPLKVGRSFPPQRQIDDDIGVHDPRSPVGSTFVVSRAGQRRRQTTA